MNGALIVAAVLAALLASAHLLDRQLRGRGTAKARGARWASRRDLRALRVKAPPSGRLVLGRDGRRLLAAEERASVVVVGPSTISLKTSGLAIPSVLEWQRPVVAARG